MAARQGRRKASVEEAYDILEGQQTCSEKYLSMLHMKLHGYLSHIAEVTAILRGIPAFVQRDRYAKGGEFVGVFADLKLP